MAAHQSTNLRSNAQDLTGRRFGRWVVIEFSHRAKGKNRTWVSLFWLCRCDCGATRSVDGGNLLSGASSSCGCWNQDRRLTRNGLSNVDGYRTYLGILSRCYNEKDPAFYLYGGSGISICKRWLYGEAGKSGLQCFLEDVRFDRRPSRNHTLDRKDNAGIYEPSNVRWATKKEQANNRRNTTLVDIDGSVMPIAELARREGIPVETLRKRWKAGARGSALIQKHRMLPSRSKAWRS